MANIIVHNFNWFNPEKITREDFARGCNEIGGAAGAMVELRGNAEGTLCELHWDTDIMAFPGDQDYSPITAASDKANWVKARAVRTALLQETDYLALSDNPMSAEMTTYRQNLRDLPATYPDSKDIVWPTKP